MIRNVGTPFILVWKGVEVLVGGERGDRVVVPVPVG